MERDEKGGRGKWKDEGVIFHCLFLDSIYYTSTCVISHIQTLIFSLPPSRLFLSVSPFGFLCQSSAVFICLSVIFSFCLFSAAVLSAVSRLCEEGVNDVALNIGCVLSTPSHICVCERETLRETERESEMRWRMTLSGCF